MSHEHVLVVDDNNDTRELFAAILERDGFVVAQARDGAAALHMLVEHETPDVIVLDLLMPRMDGWTFLERLRAFGPPYTRLPVVGMSAFHVRSTGLPDVAAFLPKPFEADELSAAVVAALRQRPSP